MASILDVKNAIKAKLAAKITTLPNFRKNSTDDVGIFLSPTDSAQVTYPGLYLSFRDYIFDRKTQQSEENEEVYEDGIVTIKQSPSPIILNFHLKAYTDSQLQDDLLTMKVPSTLGRDGVGYVMCGDEVCEIEFYTVHNYKYDDLTKDIPKFHRQWEVKVFTRMTLEDIEEQAIEEFNATIYNEETIVDVVHVDS